MAKQARDEDFRKDAPEKIYSAADCKIEDIDESANESRKQEELYFGKQEL